MIKRKLNSHEFIAITGFFLFVLFFAHNFNHGERIQYLDGLGWDGSAYADWAQRDSIEVLTSNKIPSYYIGRLLPSIMIHNISRLLDYDITSTPRVIHAFYIWNFCLLLVGLGFLILIGRHYKWKLPIYVLAFSALYLNYPILTNLSYNPTLVDVSAYVLGIASFYFYIRDKFVQLIVTSTLAAFTWPTMLYGAIPLIVFGRTMVQSREQKKHGHIFALLAGILLLSLATYLYMVENLRQAVGTTIFKREMLYITMPLFIGYIYYGLRQLIDIPAYYKAAKKTRWYKVGVGVILFITINQVTTYFSDGSPGPLTIKSYLGLFTQASLSNPLINVVAHAMHYGPFYLLTMILWPKLVSLAKTEGLGLAIFVMLFTFLSIGSESRQFINAWPVFAILVCEIVNRMSIKNDWFFVYSMVIIGLILSRFWLTINVAPWTGNFQEFPDQMLYMYSGPWISHQMYGVFLAITILTLLAIVSMLRINVIDRTHSNG